jgi:hypothetical protein
LRLWQSSVYMKMRNETDIEAMARIQSMDLADIHARGPAMHALHKRIYAQNDAVVAPALRPHPAGGTARYKPQTEIAQSKGETWSS